MKKQQQLHKIFKVGFKVLNGIQLKGESNPLLPIICKISQVVTIIGYLIISAFDMMASFIDPSQQYIWDITRLSLAVFSLILVFAIFTNLIIEYRLFNEMGTLQEHKSILKVNSIITSAIYYTCEVLYFFGSFLFFISISLLGTFQTQDYILVIFCSILFVIQSTISLAHRLFGMASIIIPLVLVFMNSILSIVILFLFSIMYFYRQGSNHNGDNCELQRILYFIIGVTCVWSFLQIEYTTNPQNIVAFINLSFITLSSMGIYFAYPEIFSSSSLLTDNKKLLKWHKKQVANESSSQSEDGNQINLKQEMLYEKHFQEMQHYKMLCYHQNIRASSTMSWKQKQRNKFLWEKLKWSKDNDNSFEMNIFYFKSGFYLRISIIALLKEMTAYLDKNRNLGLESNYEIYKLNQEVFKYYEQSGNGNDSALQIADVVDAERHYHQFYQQLDQLLLEMVQFWKQVLANDFNINSQIENKINCVCRLEKQAKKSLQRLKFYRINDEERLFSLVREIINSYQPNLQELTERNKSEKGNSFQYVILQGDQIMKISLKLLKSLGFQANSIDVHSIRTLLPVNFFTYLEQIQKKFLEQNELRQFVLPIIHSSGSLVLKQCLMYIVPHSSSAIQYLITFQSIESTSQIFILYNSNKQKLELFNTGFREFIGMKVDSFKQFASGQNILFSNDVFQTDLGAEDLLLLKSHEIIKTKIIYSDFYLRKNSLFNYNDEVTLHLEHEFSFNNQNYLLINIQSESYRQVKIEAEQKSQTHLKNLNKEKQIHEQYAHQQFFCKIENPYKSKIIQKLSNIRKRTYKSYFYQILIIKIIMLVLVVVNSAVFNVLSTSMLSNGLNDITVMLNLNNEYMYLWRLFSGTYSNYLFMNNPNASYTYLNYNFFKNQATAGQLQDALKNVSAFYAASNDRNSQNVMNTYLLYKPGVSDHNQMSYNLAFDQFNITTNTMLTSFYDFIVEVEQGFNDGSGITFLAKNYDEIVRIMPIYQQYEAFADDYTNQFQILQILGYVFIIILTLSIIISFISTAKMINTHEQMHLLYKFIDRSDVRKIIKELNIIKLSIGNVNLESEQHMSHKNYEDLLTKRQLKESSTKEIHEVSSNFRQQAENKEKTCIKAIIKTFKYIFFCPILFASGWLVLSVEYSNMRNDQQDYSQIANLLQKIQTDQFLIEKLYSDLMQPELYSLNFGKYNQTMSKIVIKNQFYSEGLPQIFSDDVKLDENLCQDKYIKPITIPYFAKSVNECIAMELGIISKGYSQTLQFYQTYLRDETKLNFNQYLTINASRSNKMKEIIFIKQLLFNYLKIKKTNFLANYATYIAVNQAQDLNIFIFSLIACACLFIILIYNVLTLYRVMFIVINIICAIPTTAMYKMAMTNYIRREDILAKMDKL